MAKDLLELAQPDATDASLSSSIPSLFWNNVDVRCRVLDILYAPTTSSFKDRILADLMTVNQSTFLDCVTRVYREIGPTPERMMHLGLRLYMEHAGASEERIRLYISKVQRWHLDAKVSGGSRRIETLYFDSYPNLVWTRYSPVTDIKVWGYRKAHYGRFIAMEYRPPNYGLVEGLEDFQSKVHSILGNTRPLSSRMRHLRPGPVPGQLSNELQAPLSDQTPDICWVNFFAVHGTNLSAQDLISFIGGNARPDNLFFEKLELLNVEHVKFDSKELKELGRLCSNVAHLSLTFSGPMDLETLRELGNACPKITNLQISCNEWPFALEESLGHFATFFPSLFRVNFPVDVRKEGKSSAPSRIPDFTLPRSPRHPNLSFVTLAFLSGHESKVTALEISAELTSLLGFYCTVKATAVTGKWLPDPKTVQRASEVELSWQVWIRWYEEAKSRGKPGWRQL